MLSVQDEYTPTPAISHTIMVYNRERTSGLAEGIVVTPSHDPPDNGGFKYNPPDGGPADADVTDWIEATANDLLRSKLEGVRRVSLANPLRAPTTHRHDYVDKYVSDLDNVLDMDVIRGAKLHFDVDPPGVGVHYWARIAARYLSSRGDR